MDRRVDPAVTAGIAPLTLGATQRSRMTRMQMEWSAFTLLMALALAVPARAQDAAKPAPDWDSEPAQVFVEGDALHYYGALEVRDVNRLLQALVAAPATVSRLVVTSRGGDAVAAIAAGEAVRARGLAVEVVGRGCGSSCANYLFVPARSRTIAPGSLVMFHNSCPTGFSEDPAYWRGWLRRNYGGGLPVDRSQVRTARAHEDVRRQFEQDLDTHAAQFVQTVRDTKAGHRRIFDGSGIDDRLLCLGDHLELPRVTGTDGGYMYTLDPVDMARFGVCDVAAPDDYVARAERYFRSRADLQGRVGVVRLADHPGFVPQPGVACR